MGVSGFLISCASLRATSPQAATFCARISGVRSSRTRTAPGGEPGAPGSGTTVTARCRSRPRPGTTTSRSWRAPRPERRRCTSPTISSRPAPLEGVGERAAHAVGVHVEQAAGGGVEGGDRAFRVHDHDAGADRLQDRLHEAAAVLQLLVLPREAGARVLDLLLAARQPLRHAVEGGDEGGELVVAGREVDAHAALAGRDALRAFRHQPQRGRDAAREVEGEPDRAEQDEQGREEVQREVDGLDRLLEALRLAVLLVALLHLAALGGDRRPG